MYVAAGNCLLDSVPADPPNLRIHVFAGIGRSRLDQTGCHDQSRPGSTSSGKNSLAITTVCLRTCSTHVH